MSGENSMLKDRYGLELSTSSSVARDAYVEAVDAVLSATGDAEKMKYYIQEAIQIGREFLNDIEYDMLQHLKH